MLNFSNITGYAVVGTNSPDLVNRMLKIFWYCRTFARWKSQIIFSCIPVPPMPGVEVIQIPTFANPPYEPHWQVFIAKVMPRLLLQADDADFFMWLHEDGFPVEPQLWTPEFLKYDFISAPWRDGVVGGSGMSLFSRGFANQKALLPFYTGIRHGNNEDEFAARKHRMLMIERGIKFAPPALAYRFSTENNGNENPSFAFHGRVWKPDKYTPGWRKVEAAQA